MKTVDQSWNLGRKKGHRKKKVNRIERKIVLSTPISFVFGFPAPTTAQQNSTSALQQGK
jgi:hypothetical protein